MKNLILHIGTGKTGISSIRNQLTKKNQDLKANDIFYLGKFFEHSPLATKPDWMHPSGFYRLKDASSDFIEAELSNSLHSIAEKLPENATCIIANESLHHAPNPFAHTFTRAASSINCNLHAIAYVREHSSYLKSAYKQWGVRHKTQKGPVLGFKKWCMTQERFSVYAKQINDWDILLKNELNVYNYSAIEDINEHFFETIKRISGISANFGIETERFYETPAEEAILIHALHNNRFFSQQLPHTVNDYLKHHYKTPENPPLNLKQVQTSQEKLLEILDTPKIKDDIELVNTILRQKGQPLHDKTKKSRPELEGSERQSLIISSLLSSLVSISISQHNEIKKLKDELKSINALVAKIGNNPQSDDGQTNFFEIKKS